MLKKCVLNFKSGYAMFLFASAFQKMSTSVGVDHRKTDFAFCVSAADKRIGTDFPHGMCSSVSFPSDDEKCDSSRLFPHVVPLFSDITGFSGPPPPSDLTELQQHSESGW